MQDLFGMSGEEMFGKNFEDLHYPENLAKHLNSHIDYVFATGKAVQDEVFYTSPTGQSGYFQYACGSVIGKDGSVELMVGISRDVTKRRQIESRQRLMLQLSGAIRSVADPVEIQHEALKAVGEFLDLDRVMYNEIEPGKTTYTIHVNYVREGFTPHIERFPFQPFAKPVKHLAQGNTTVIEDVETDKCLSKEAKDICRSISVRAFVAVPLIKQASGLATLQRIPASPATGHNMTYPPWRKRLSAHGLPWKEPRPKKPCVQASLAIASFQKSSNKWSPIV